MKIVELTEKWMAAREPFLPQMTKKIAKKPLIKKWAKKVVSKGKCFSPVLSIVCYPWVLIAGFLLSFFFFFFDERETASLDMDSLVCNLLLRSVCS